MFLSPMTDVALLMTQPCQHDYFTEITSDMQWILSTALSVIHVQAVIAQVKGTKHFAEGFVGLHKGDQ